MQGRLWAHFSGATALLPLDDGRVMGIASYFQFCRKVYRGHTKLKIFFLPVDMAPRQPALNRQASILAGWLCSAPGAERGPEGGGLQGYALCVALLLLGDIQR